MVCAIYLLGPFGRIVHAAQLHNLGDGIKLEEERLVSLRWYPVDYVELLEALDDMLARLAHRLGEFGHAHHASYGDRRLRVRFARPFLSPGKLVAIALVHHRVVDARARVKRAWAGRRRVQCQKWSTNAFFTYETSTAADRTSPCQDSWQCRRWEIQVDHCLRASRAGGTSSKPEHFFARTRSLLG